MPLYLSWWGMVMLQAMTKTFHTRPQGPVGTQNIQARNMEVANPSELAVYLYHRKELHICCPINVLCKVRK